MPVFQSPEDIQHSMGRLYDEAKCDPRIAPDIKDSNLVIRFRYHQPDAVVTIKAASLPTQPNAYFDVVWGEQEQARPDIELVMHADVAHHFWQGKVNLLAALARRQIVAKGPIPKLLKLLPTVAPMYEMYPRILRDIGRADLIV